MSPISSQVENSQEGQREFVSGKIEEVCSSAVSFYKDNVLDSEEIRTLLETLCNLRFKNGVDTTSLMRGMNEEAIEIIQKSNELDETQKKNLLTYLKAGAGLVSLLSLDKNMFGTMLSDSLGSLPKEWQELRDYFWEKWYEVHPEEKH